jgi:O-antigen ligase
MYESSLLVSVAIGKPDVGDSWTRFFVKALGFLVVGLFVVALRSRTRITSAHWAYVWSGILPIAGAMFQEAVFALSQRIPPLPLSLAQSENTTGLGTIFRGLPRVSSTLLEPNYLGMFCAACFLLAAARLYFGVLQRLPIQWGLFGVAVGSALALIFSLSLSALAGLAVGLVAFALVLRVRWRIVAVITAIALVALVTSELAFSKMGSEFGVVEMLRVRVDGRMGSVDVFDRREFLETGFHAFVEHPVLGIGLGGLDTRVGISTAHSAFLTVLGEQGLAGFASAAGLYVFVIYSASKAARRFLKDADHEMACTGAGLVGALVGLCVSNLMYDALFSFDSSWILIGMGAGYAANAHRLAAHVGDSRSPATLNPV